MADFNGYPQPANATENSVNLEVRQVGNRELEEHKDEIIAWYRSGATLKDLLQFGEERLGVKASLKAYRIALKRWKVKKYVSKEDKIEMLEILRNCEAHRRSVQFEVYGKPYSVSKLQRPVTKHGETFHLSQSSTVEPIPHPNEKVQIEIEYSYPSHPAMDPAAADGHSRQTMILWGNVNTTSNDRIITSQDQISKTKHNFTTIPLTRPEDSFSHRPSDTDVMVCSRIPNIGGQNSVHTTPLLFLWQWMAVNMNSVKNITMATDIGRDYARITDLYQKHFGIVPYDPTCMNKYFEKLLEDDQLEEAEEIVCLAVEVSERWLGLDHVEFWKAKGKLAHVYHEQGRYNDAYELGCATTEFFKRNGTEFDPNALVFKTNLAGTLLTLGDMREAKNLCYSVIEIARQILGNEHDITLTAKFMLAKVCNKLQDHERAREILQEIVIAREGQLRQHGRLDSKILRTYLELANTLQYIGHDMEAIKIQGFVERNFREPGVIRSMWTLEVVDSVGRLLYCLKEYVGAEYVFRNLVKQSIIRSKSRRHPKVVIARCWLANSLYYQMKQQESIEIYQDCISILNEVFGPKNRYTLIVMSNLAWSREVSMTVVEFEARMDEVRKLQKEYLGDNDPDALASERCCAELMWRRGEWNDSWEVLKQIQERLETISEPQRSYVDWELMTSKANYFIAKGNYQEAAFIQHRQMNLGESIFGREHTQAMVARDSLAWTKSKMGYPNDAENLLCEGISRLSGSLGSKHPAVTKLRASYASMLSAHNNLVSAEIIERQILQEWKAYGEEHPYFIQATRELAVNCRKLRKFSEADNLFRRAIEASKVIFGPADKKVANILIDYAYLMTAMGNFRDARVLHETSLAMIRMWLGNLPAGNFQQAVVLEQSANIGRFEGLAHVLEKMGEFSESLNLRDKILSLRIKFLGPSHPKTIRAAYNLAGTYWNLGDSTKALYIYRDCLEKTSSVLGKLNPLSLKVREKLGVILSKLGHFTESKHHFDELLVAVKSTKGENSIELIDVLCQIAGSYLNQDQYARAAEQFRYALQILEMIGGTSEKVLEYIVRLANCYRLDREFERAEIELEAAIKKGQEDLEHEHPILCAQSRLAWTYLEAGKCYEAENLARVLLQKLEEKN